MNRLDNLKDNVLLIVGDYTPGSIGAIMAMSNYCKWFYNNVPTIAVYDVLCDMLPDSTDYNVVIIDEVLTYHTLRAIADRAKSTTLLTNKVHLEDMLANVNYHIPSTIKGGGNLLCDYLYGESYIPKLFKQLTNYGYMSWEVSDKVIIPGYPG